MADFSETKKALVNCLEARIPLVIVDTNERERVEKAFAQIRAEKGYPIYYYTDSGQVEEVGKTTGISTNDDPLGFFLDRMKKNRNLNIVLGDVQNVSTDSLYARELVNLLYQACRSNSVVVIITSDNVWDRIRGFGISVTLDLPNEEERTAQINRFIESYQNRYTVEWTKDDILHAVALMKGFTEIQINNILSEEIISQNGLRSDRVYSLDRQKRRLYGKADAIQYIEVDPELQVSGMNNLKAWLEEKRQIFFMKDETLRKHDLKPPKGILLVGVPGCGKSLTAKMISSLWGIPLFRFDTGSIFDKWVGGSEKRMREALQFIEHVSPCILWIDEIEKGLSNSSSENDTSKRVLGEFLFWAQESSSRVFMVATANDVKALPYELYRKGRFSEIFFLGLPDREARAELFKQYVRRSLLEDIEPDLLSEVVEKTEGFSHSDIEAVVKEAAQSKLLGEAGFDLRAELLRSCEGVIPISRVNPELIREITEWGKDRTRNV